MQAGLQNLPRKVRFLHGLPISFDAALVQRQDVPLSAGRQGFNSPTRRHATIAQQVEHSVEARGALVRYQFVAPSLSGSSFKVGAPVRSRDRAGSIPAALTTLAEPEVVEGPGCDPGGRRFESARSTKGL